MTLKHFTAEMPLRSGDHKPTEKLAKDLAGGVGWHDSQPWEHQPLRERIHYPPRKDRQTRIPLESSWKDTEPNEATLRRRGCWPVCRHTADQCPTKPEYDARSSWAPPIPNPEGHRLPKGMRFKGQWVINTMTFDDRPWLDSAPIEVQSKAGYPNFTNDVAALEKATEKGLLRTDDLGRWYRKDWGPGDFWAREDRKHRKASAPPKLSTADASQPPDPRLLDRADEWLRMTPEQKQERRAQGDTFPYFPPDSLSSLRGRRCKSCLGRMPDQARTKVRYCTERCRNRSENAQRRGLAGTISSDIELSSFAVDGKRIGIDTVDLGFSRLLVDVA